MIVDLFSDHSTLAPRPFLEHHLKPQAQNRRRAYALPAGDKGNSNGPGSGADGELLLLRTSNNLDVRCQL